MDMNARRLPFHCTLLLLLIHYWYWNGPESTLRQQFGFPPSSSDSPSPLDYSIGTVSTRLSLPPVPVRTRQFLEGIPVLGFHSVEQNKWIDQFPTLNTVLCLKLKIRIIGEHIYARFFDHHSSTPGTVVLVHFPDDARENIGILSSHGS
jgi:hypothetical protein